MSYRNMFCTIMLLAVSSYISHAGEKGFQQYQEMKARAAREAAQRAADQRARDANWKRIQAQLAAERARAAAAQKKK